MTAVLRVVNVSAYYGAVQVLRGVSLHVEAGEIVALIGANGAGKSTLLRVISGLHRISEGELSFQGRSIQRLSPERIVRSGLVQVPEARQLFPNLTVWENLELGGAFHGRRHIREALPGDEKSHSSLRYNPDPYSPRDSAFPCCTRAH